MNENSNSEGSTKKKSTTIDRLTRKREELEKELKATQHLLRSKKAAQTAKKAAKDRKDRTKALILIGLLYMEQTEENITAKNLQKPEIITLINEMCTNIARRYKDKKDRLSSSLPQKNEETLKKNISRLENDLMTVLSFLRKELIKTIKEPTPEVPQSTDQTPQE